MSELDIVVFGATGFTGKKVVEEMVRVAKKVPFTWGVAGRSKNKLETLIAEISKKTGEDLSKIRIIIADVNTEKSLTDMCYQARILVNCCGPYKLYGEPVVKAAIASHSHYVDVCGEPLFLETMQLVYNQQARDAGVYIIGACGFDSVPNDMGVVFLQQHFRGTLNSVESYLKVEMRPEVQRIAARNGFIHYATWESLIHSVVNAKELGPIRKKLFTEPFPPLKPKLETRPLLHKNNGKWCLPFPGADRSIVYRTQRYLYETQHKRSVQFRPYVEMPNLFLTIVTLIGIMIVYIMTMSKFTRKLLLNYPRFFSFGTITRDDIKDEILQNTEFELVLKGQGWPENVDINSTEPNKTLVAKVSGKDPGYGLTATAAVYSAITILMEQHKIPGSGGVMTTGSAFHSTDFIKNLNENNVKFEIVDDV